jgi:hypothetical protein
MRTDPDVTSAVRSWLDEGVDRLPERVLDSVLDAVPAIAQRRSWQPTWLSSLPSLARSVAIAAAVIVTVVGGVRLASPNGIGGPAPTPTPSPVPSTSLVPTDAPVQVGGPVVPAIVDTILDAGTHRVASPFRFPFSVSLPADTRVALMSQGGVGFATPDGSLEAYVPNAVFPDPCRAEGSPVPVRTADEVVAALSSMTGFAASSPVQTAVDGHPARQFVLTNSIDTATAKCARGLMLPLFTYAGATDGAATNGGTRQVVWVFDLNGRPVLVMGDGWQDASREALRTLVNTIAFD